MLQGQRGKLMVGVSTQVVRAAKIEKVEYQMPARMACSDAPQAFLSPPLGEFRSTRMSSSRTTNNLSSLPGLCKEGKQNSIAAREAFSVQAVGLKQYRWERGCTGGRGAVP